MLKLSVNNVTCLPYGGTSDELKWLDGILKVRKAGYFHSPMYKARRWDGYVHLLKKSGFPSGLLGYVLRQADIDRIEVTLRDTRQPVSFRTSALTTIHGKQLRDYQTESIHRILANTLSGLYWPRGIVQIGTAGGKTAAMAYACDLISGRILILVHTKDLLTQIAKELQSILREKVGMIGSGSMEYNTRIVVGTVQTVKNLIDEKTFLRSFRAVFIDEAHRASAQMYQDICAVCEFATVRIGFTATAEREDILETQLMRGVLGDILFEKNAAELIDEGYVAPVHVWYVPIEEPTGYWHMPWRDGVYQKLIVENDYRNKLFAHWMMSRTKPTLLIVNHKDHGQWFKNYCNVPYVDGDEKDTVRAKLIRDLKENRVLHAIATPIFDEGVNAPAIKHIGFAAGYKAPGRFKQRIGRGQRKEHDEDLLTCLDTVDLTHKRLAEHSKQRMQTAALAGFRVELVKGKVENLI